MYDFKWIKENKLIFEEGIKKRGLKIDTGVIIDFYNEYVSSITKLQYLQNERNKTSKNIGIKKSKGEDASAEISSVAKLKNAISELQEVSDKLYDKIKSLVEVIPNMPSEDVPLGVDENDNQIIKTYGEKKHFSFTPKSHDELGLQLQMMDFEQAANISGARFVILKSKLAKLERALASFMLDLHIDNHNYTEINPPSLVRSKSLYGTGQLPKFEEDLFRTNSDHWLIPTAEVPLTNLVSGSIIDINDLPLRFTGLTNCFRSEAGSAGKDTKGMIRLHEFKKVELVSITNSADSEKEHQRMLSCAEEVLIKLQLPYQIVNLCSGDLGFAASKTYDIEVWLPSQNLYREISSCSNCRSFQAKRMHSRYRDECNDIKSLHTLNGSGVAVGRALLAIMENYQEEDGSISVPDVLIPYMNGIKKISAGE